MARALDSVLQAHQQQLRDEDPWIWLYEFEIPTDPPTRYRLTNYTESVSFGTNPNTTEAIVYSPFPIDHGEIDFSRRGDLPSITVRVANVTREVSETIEENNGLLGQPAVVRLINAANLTDTAAQVRFDARIVRVRMSPEVAALELATVNLRDVRIPRRRYLSSHCPFQFGDDECNYVILPSVSNSIGGGFDFCPKNLVACVERGDDEVARGLPRTHALRFGGQIGVGRRE